MANIKGKNADGADTFLKATGAGTDLDPHVSEVTAILSATDNAVLDSIDSSLQGTLTVNNGGTFAVQIDTALPAGTNNIGDVDVASVAIPTSIYNGQKTVSTAGTAEALSASQAILQGVTIKALSDNTGNIYVGDSSVDDTNGYVLASGEVLPLPIANLSTVYIDADNDGEGVSFVAT
jgi:hypothetical protein